MLVMARVMLVIVCHFCGGGAGIDASNGHNNLLLTLDADDNGNAAANMNVDKNVEIIDILTSGNRYIVCC